MKYGTMSGLAPSDTDVREDHAENGDLKVLWLDDEDADTLINSLSSETARSILTALHGSPSTASELSDAVDTSLQNVRHHLGKLQSAGLVEVTDTRYSVKGREMNVYAPASDSLVVAIGREEDRDGFLDSLRRIVGAVAALVAASLAVQFAFGAGVVDLGGPATAPRVADSVGGGTAPILGLLPPGVAFLAGGALVLALLFAWDRLYR
jgi:DNA-binding transcriptional ArsR family regulator